MFFPCFKPTQTRASSLHRLVDHGLQESHLDHEGFHVPFKRLRGAPQTMGKS